MEYNLLDRIMDEDYYGPGSAEFLLRGMSPEGQKRFIKDLSKKIASRISASGRPLERKSYAKDLERMVNNMPEELQDSWLISASRPKTIYLDHDFEHFTKPSVYEPSTNHVRIRDNVQGDLVDAVLHEVGHHADYNMSHKRPKDGKKVRMSAAAFNDLGSDIRDELLGEKTDSYMEYITGKEKFDGEDADIFDPKQQLIDNVDEYVYSTVPSESNPDLKQKIGARITDWHSLNQRFPFEIGHGNVYRTRKRHEGLENLAGDSYIMPWQDRSRFDADRLEEVDRFVKQYPIAIEGPSNIYEILGYEGGAEWLRKNSPKTYAKMEKLAKEDIRKGKFVPPSEKYADELGMSLLKERKEKALARKQKVLDRYRAEFMTLPEDKRAYYENAKPGDILWFKLPDFPEGENQYSIIKGDPRYVFRGNKLQRVRSGYDGNTGRFSKGKSYTDLNNLAPGFVPSNEFDIEQAEYESRKVLEALERSNKRRK